MSAPLPPVPVLQPAPALSTAWYITTIAGILIPVMTAVAVYVPAPWNAVLIAIAGGIGTALGVSHPGTVTPTAPTLPAAKP